MPVKRATVKTAKLSPKTKDVVRPKIILQSPAMASKLKQPKIFIPLIIIVLILIAFYFRGLFVAALVNGQPITRLEVIAELEKQGGRQTLSSLVNQALILQEAKKKNIQASQEDIDAAVKQIEDSLKAQGQDMDTALAVQGMTRKDFLMQLRLRNLVEKLLAGKIKVTDEEIADYIEKNKDAFPADFKEDEVKKSVGEQLKQQKLATESQAWLAELAKNAKINYFVNY